jgi:ribosomal protein S18 acetylase RimI-like enzyme
MMNKIVQELTDPTLPAAIERNFAEEMISFGRGLPGGEVHEDAELLWFFTGRAHLNGILLTHFAQDDKAYIDAKIEETLAYFKARQVDVGWSVGPSTQPGDLADHLEEHGFVYGIDTIGMAVALQSTHDDVHTSASLTIREALDSETLLQLRDIEAQGFGGTPEIAQTYYDAYVGVGFGENAAWHHYIGYLDGKAVAITSLLLYAGIAGIYGVATIPEVRRQGIGATMTLHALHQARTFQYQIAALSPSEMSQGIYERLGFREYCRISHYGWSSAS